MRASNLKQWCRNEVILERSWTWELVVDCLWLSCHEKNWRSWYDKLTGDGALMHYPYNLPCGVNHHRAAKPLCSIWLRNWFSSGYSVQCLTVLVLCWDLWTLRQLFVAARNEMWNPHLLFPCGSWLSKQICPRDTPGALLGCSAAKSKQTYWPVGPIYFTCA